jgi:hypothetical protein
VAGNERCRRRAQLTFAMARHACVDLSLVFWLPPPSRASDRLSAAELEVLVGYLSESRATPELAQRLTELRALYEPFLEALSDYFCLRLPSFFPDRRGSDNWQSSAWTKRAPGITELTELPAGSAAPEQHFG